jgi:predicted phosphodiesterase
MGNNMNVKSGQFLKPWLVICSVFLILFLLSFASLLNSPLASTMPVSTSTVNTPAEIPRSVLNSFGKNPETDRNFTWETLSVSKGGVIEFCEKDQFKDFKQNNVSKKTARSYSVKTNSDTRRVYKVELTNLKPGTRYVYRVGRYPNSFSKQAVFATAGRNLQEFTFLTVTDTQGITANDYSKWKLVLDKALKNHKNASFLVHTGDIVDAGDDVILWDRFTDAAKNQLLSLPIAPVVGNHDARNENQSNPECRNFVDRFNVPKVFDSGAPAGTTYSFDYGDAHFAIMNTQCRSANLAKQAAWLQRDMARTKKTWKIVALHRGPYGATYDTADIRDAWAPVFDKLGIDLVFEGHDHNYMRSYPIKNKLKANYGKGTVYVVGNTGGIKFYPKRYRPWQAVDLQPYTQMYLAATVTRHKIEIKAYDIKNTLRDSFVLKK